MKPKLCFHIALLSLVLSILMPIFYWTIPEVLVSYLSGLIAVAVGIWAIFEASTNIKGKEKTLSIVSLIVAILAILNVLRFIAVTLVVASL